MPSKYVPLRGGLTLSVSPLDVYPGAIKDSLNYYEDTAGGYTTIAGFERFDGKLAPSEDNYYVATFDNWDTHTVNILAGSTITVASTMTFRVLEIDTTTADVLTAYVCQVVAADIPTDLDEVPLSWDGTSRLIQLIPRAAPTDLLDEYYRELAWNYTRAQVGEIPGTGVAVGALQIDDTIIGFRNDSTTPKAYKAGSTGWVEVPLGRAIEITSYTADSILPGETFESGKFVIIAVAEWFTPATDLPDVTKAWLVVAPTTVDLEPSTGSATASGGATFTVASVLNSITEWGSYIEYQSFNFLATPDANSAWFVDGANHPMAYSAQYNAILPVCPNFNKYANYRLATDIRVHLERLMYASGKGTFTTSEPGNPYNFSGTFGAAEIGVGDIITDMMEADSQNMIVYTTTMAKKLAGTDSSNWSFLPAAGSVGSAPRGVQKMDDLYSFSSRGVASIRRANVEGGYLGGSISTPIQEAVAGLSSKLNCSNAVTSKEQVRWYFNDNTFLCMSRIPAEGGFRFGYGLCDYGMQVKSISTDVWSTGIERSFFVNGADGYLYEADKGSNFDGLTIYTLLEPHSNHLGSPDQNKSYKRVFWETKSTEYALLTLGFSLNYGDKTFDAQSIETFGGRDVFDESLWDSARFNAQDRTRSRGILKGTGFTIGFTIDNTSKFTLPFTVTGYTIQFNQVGKARK